MIWIAIGIIAAGTLCWLLRPLMTPVETDPRQAHDLAIYRAQLAEVERDIERGVIPDTEAEAARLEIQRRLLAAAGEGSEETTTRKAPGLAAALPLALLVSFGALSIYLVNGAPDRPALPFAEREKAGGEAAKRLARADAEIAALREKTRQSPKDARAWATLGYALTQARRQGEAAAAYKRAVDLEDPEIARGPLLAAYGEALTEAAGGTVTPAARAAFTKAVAADPGEARARYYLGLAEIQAGKAEAGLKIWIALEAASKESAPWLAPLRTRMDKVAKENSIDLAALRKTVPAAKGPPAKGPTQKDIEAAGSMPPEQRAAMIRSMVDGLEVRLKAAPDDWEGWVRLGRSRRVLKEFAKAEEAFGKAAALQPENIAVLVDHGQAMLEANPPKAGDAFAPEFVALMQRIEKLAPENPVALWFLGLEARQQGEIDAARRYWTKLLPLLPGDAPQRKQLEAQLKALN